MSDKTSKPSSHRLATPLVASLIGLGGIGLAAYATMQDASFLPLGVAMIVLAGVEALFVHASGRR